MATQAFERHDRFCQTNATSGATPVKMREGSASADGPGPAQQPRDSGWTYYFK